MTNLQEMKSRLSYMIEDFYELHSEGAHELADSMQPNIDKLMSDIRELEAEIQIQIQIQNQNLMSAYNTSGCYRVYK